MNNYKYSICVANLNMGKTIGQALTSVLDSIDERFEMIVVDDGSSDSSIETLEVLKRKYSNLRTIYLAKDNKRTLAETRNISVEAANGEYCLMHIDCDDLWEPYLIDFVKVFHAIEEIYPGDFLLKAHQVNMGRKEFLIGHGPYKYGHMVEDRDMWLRMAKLGSLVPLEHVIFRHRMPLSRRQKMQKKFFLTGVILRDEIRAGQAFSYYFRNIYKDYMKQSIELRFYKILIYPFCYITAKKLGPIADMKPDPEWETLVANPVKQAKTVFEMFEQVGKSFGKQNLSTTGDWVFTHKSTEKNINELPKDLF